MKNKLLHSIILVLVCVAVANGQKKIDTMERPLENRDKRMTEFRNRNSAENIEQVAKQLAGMLDLGKEGLEQTKRCYDNKKYKEFLLSFRNLYLKKLRDANIDWKDYRHNFTSPSNPNNPDELMSDIIKNAKGTTTNIGEPGSIDWHPRTNLLWFIDQFYVLIDEFRITKDIAYLDKFFKFGDDWSMNVTGYDDTLLGDILDSDRGNNALPTFNRTFKQLAVQLSEKEWDAIPEASFARLIMQLIRRFPPTAILYARSNPQNWTPMMAIDILETGILLDDFHTGQLYLREAIRLMEMVYSRMIMPDGTAQEQNLNYSREYTSRGAALFVELLKGNRPDLVNPDWEDELKKNVIVNYNFEIRMLNTLGQYPSGNRNDLRNYATDLRSNLERYAPEVFKDSDNSAILSIATGKGNQSIPFYVVIQIFGALFFRKIHSIFFTILI